MMAFSKKIKHMVNKTFDEKSTSKALIAERKKAVITDETKPLST